MDSNDFSTESPEAKSPNSPQIVNKLRSRIVNSIIKSMVIKNKNS